MDKQRLDYFRNLLIEQGRRAIQDLRVDRATALEGDDGVTDGGERSELDLNTSTALNLGGRKVFTSVTLHLVGYAARRTSWSSRLMASTHGFRYDRKEFIC